MAVFDYPYRKSINITAWVLQIIVSLAYIALSAFVLAVAADYDGQYSGYFAIAGGIHIAIAGLTIAFDITEMVLIGRKRMNPALYLTSACIKTLIWTIMLILNLIAVSPLAIVLCAVAAGTAIAQLVYGARLVHHKRRGTLRGGGYAPAATGGPAHMESGYGQQQPVYANYANNTNTAYDTGYGNPPAAGYYYPPQQGTEYKPPTSPAPPQYYGQQQAPVGALSATARVTARVRTCWYGTAGLLRFGASAGIPGSRTSSSTAAASSSSDVFADGTSPHHFLCPRLAVACATPQAKKELLEGTFAEYVNVEKTNAYPLPEGADPVAFAASAMSSWMALTQRTSQPSAGVHGPDPRRHQREG
ncbi:hypothetical protein DL771_008036 [Monosporascus sp. 5C6A]|nr:hypothetical protein DL771_008036 [Monosporascus sp. 5C6A]